MQTVRFSPVEVIEVDLLRSVCADDILIFQDKPGDSPKYLPYQPLDALAFRSSAPPLFDGRQFAMHPFGVNWWHPPSPGSV